MNALASTFARLGFQVSDPAPGTPATTLLIIPNRDGSPRWIWPSDLRQPLFLACYNQSGWRARLQARLIRLVFFLRLQALVFRRAVVEAQAIEEMEQGMAWEGKWALFTGTSGPQRKLIVVTERDGIQQFVKVGVGARSAAALHNEAVALSHLHALQLTGWSLPSVTDARHGSLTMTAVGHGGTRRAVLTQTHQQALVALARRTERVLPIAQLPAWQAMEAQLVGLHRAQDQRLPLGLLRKLELLKAQIDPDRPIRACMAHGDFTPWNMFLQNGQLAVYDFENWQPLLPLGFDAFHFVIQSGILMGQHPWHKLQGQLETSVQHGFWNMVDGGDEEQYLLHLQLYLLLHIVRSLDLYHAQRQWHAQVHWLLEAWEQAVSRQLRSLHSDRRLLLMDAFDWLLGKRYVALKFNHGLPEQLPLAADVDLCVERQDARAFVGWLKGNVLVHAVHTRFQGHMVAVEAVLRSGAVVHFDLIWDLRRKWLWMMDADALRREGDVNRFGIKVPSSLSQARQIGLFYALNGAAVPSHYTAYGDLLARSPQHLDQLLYPAFDGDADQAPVVRRHLSQLPQNRGWRLRLAQLRYGWDLLRSLAGRSGYVITFSGVDGAGKSTVIDEVVNHLRKQARRRVVVLRHRPSLLPILSAWRLGRQQAEQIAAASRPRQGQNQGFMSSLLRFGYYYLDYLIGQFLVQVKYVRRGYVVVYDRYYFDFIADARRSNIDLPQVITRWAYRFLIKPRLNFFLYAAPDEILRRKQEMDRQSILQVTEAYQHLFAQLDATGGRSRYIAIENVQLATTLQAVIDRTSKAA